jgi:hypothetical protein
VFVVPCRVVLAHLHLAAMMPLLLYCVQWRFYAKGDQDPKLFWYAPTLLACLPACLLVCGLRSPPSVTCVRAGDRVLIGTTVVVLLMCVTINAYVWPAPPAECDPHPSWYWRPHLHSADDER